MLTKNEITALNLSPTKKDFVQIWNELLEVAGKLSERWDPTSTNESDPGIVILKALTGIADKLNYNIDKNTLEAFMPTAAQEDSMRKLCDMLGYNMKYYRSAETQVTIKYYNSDANEDEKVAIAGGLKIPKFTVITNSDQDISYFTTNQTPYYISSTTPSTTLSCMEGQIVKCESTTDNNIITASQISDNNRFYLPEYQIAENGIFIYNVVYNAQLGKDDDGAYWEKVDNLNVQSRGSRVFKFGYDSYEGRPYVEFPSDYGELINNGLFIYYARTSGANGNISPRTLTQLELPSGDSWSKVSATSFSVENAFAATTGANLETIGQAYSNFKKTVGTFTTLVTCRDYMNKIYTMTDSETGKYLVSNALVTDIRNDLNRSITLCSCDGAGIYYKELPLTNTTTSTKTVTVETADGTAVTGTLEVTAEEPAISHFDLVLYPFKSYTQIKGNVKDIQEVYDSSFRYNTQIFDKVESYLSDSDNKTLAHNIVAPREHDIISINNYLRLNAIIGTHSKLTTEEGALLIETIKIALANAFNMRELDFGDEIPFESLVEVIEKADSRIRVVSLVEPALYTTFSVFEGYDKSNPIIKEYAVASNWLLESDATKSGRFEYVDSKNNRTHTFDTKEAKEIYNKLAVRNVLAGRVPLFKYNTKFDTNFSEGPYLITTAIDVTEKPEELDVPGSDNPFTVWTDGLNIYTGQCDIEKDADGTPISVTPRYSKSGPPTDDSGNPKYVNNLITKSPTDDNNITKITTKCKIKTDAAPKDETGWPAITDVHLEDNEVVKFRAPNFTTVKTYPAYVNYHLKLNKGTYYEASSAEAISLTELLKDDSTRSKLINYFNTLGKLQTFKLTQKISATVDGELKKDDSFTLEIEDSPIATSETPDSILAKSGFVRIVNKQAHLSWAEGTPTSSGDELSNKLVPVINLTTPEDKSTDFITNPATFVKLKQNIDDHLLGLSNGTIEGEAKLPVENDWIITYEFEYVPFEASLLTDWSNFIETEFSAIKESGKTNVFWHASAGGYSTGKYVLANTSKLLEFTSGDFGFLESFNTRLDGIYIATNLGSDAKPNYISNDEEYMLREGERLYIEYTPSSTTEDGTTQTQETVKEVYKEGTIIRPNGFEAGLIDSSMYAQSHSAPKNITFDGAGTISLFSLGANEQIEIRDFAQVILNKETLPNASTIYVYKNFNNCAQLETFSVTGGHLSASSRINNTYTLKDGEYIFYTDQNMTEFAYFTTGTEVTLTGETLLPEFEVIDLASIFDNGIQEIPWVAKNLTGENGIIFKEFQYTTLGSGDVIDNLYLTDSCGYLDEQWQKCGEVTYTAAGSEEQSKLPKINLYGSSRGIGWEVCSTLDLNVSPNKAQTLRKTDKVETSIILHKEASSGVGSGETITISAEDTSHPIAFKTNVSCQSDSTQVNIADLYTNVDNVKSFELKVFAEETPAIVQTVKGTLIPYQNITDITNWPIETKISSKTSGELWSQVMLGDLVTDVSNAFDNALKLSTTILPNTYGIFSIYLDYSVNITNATADAGVETWLEVLPGTPDDVITFFNADTASSWTIRGEARRLVLKPGINCIRVNSSGNIFIKTTAKNGILYYDDLRLVDCQPITYLLDGETQEATTLGLNLDQIGYLNTADVNSQAGISTFSTFDAHIRKAAKTDYTNAALASLTAFIEDADTSIAAYVGELSKDSVKLEALTEFLVTLKGELTALSSKDSKEEIFSKYKTLKASLDKKITLKEALADNANYEEIEKQLLELLNSFTEIETSRQELLDRLEDLKKIAESNATTLSAEKLRKGDILADFEVNADITTYPYLAGDLKYASLHEINKRYSEQLEQLAIELSTVLSADNELASALESAGLAKRIAILGQIKILIATYAASLDNAITNLQIDTSSTSVDYTELKDDLETLKVQINNTDISLLIAQIETVTEDGLYSELADIIKALRQILEAGSSSTLTIITLLDEVLQAVADKIKNEANSVDTDITNKLEAITDKVNSAFISKLTSILTNAESASSTLQSTYTGIKNLLSESEDTRIKSIYSRLNAIDTMNSAYLTIVSETSLSDITEDYINLPFADSAVLNVWPVYLSQDLISEVDLIYKGIYGVITGNTTEYDITTSILDNRKILSDAANLTAFTELYYKAISLADRDTQNTGHKELITDLSKLVPQTSELQTALAAIDTTNYNKVILTLIDNLSKDTVAITEKQQLMQELKTELASAIKIEAQLVDIAATLVCPSILLFKKNHAEWLNDRFYSGLKLFICGEIDKLEDSASVSNYLAAGIQDACTTAVDINEKLLVAINTGDFTDFTRGESYLPETCTMRLQSIEDSLSLKAQATLALDCKLLNILKNDNAVVAWQDSDGNWMDSFGQYFKKYIRATDNNGNAINKWYSYEQYTDNNTLASFTNLTETWVDADNRWRDASGDVLAVEYMRWNTGVWSIYTEPSQSPTALSVTSEGEKWLNTSDEVMDELTDSTVITILSNLLERVSDLGNNYIASEAKGAYKISVLESLLLADIRAIDKDRDFYYNVPIESNVAIDFNEGDTTLNTLMNPSINYDVNNINNNFVISKIDINYLTNGLQIARSSRLT